MHKDTTSLVIPIKKLKEIFEKHARDCIDDYEHCTHRLRTALNSGSLIEITELLRDIAKLGTKYQRDSILETVALIDGAYLVARNKAYLRIKDAEEREKRMAREEDRDRIRAAHGLYLTQE